MNMIDVANGMIFQKMDLKIAAFEDRLISQKKIYLLQSLGTDLGYIYNWYVRGPYSPTLTSYLYANLDMLKKQDFSSYTLSDIANKNIEKVDSMRNYKNQEISTAVWYELLASTEYIIKNMGSWNVERSEESISDALVGHKPQFSHEQCKTALDVLCKNGLGIGNVENG